MDYYSNEDINTTYNDNGIIDQFESLCYKGNKLLCKITETNNKSFVTLTSSTSLSSILRR